MLNGIQVARGIAAIFVVLYHASVWSKVYYHTVFDGFFDFGYIGVDFFFVLSGFIIFYIHRGDESGLSTWKVYFTKRLVRIYPPFIPISLLLLIVYMNFPGLAKGHREIGILSSIFLIPTNYFPALEVSWTLMHEMLFYIFFSLYYFSRKYFLLISIIWGLVICANIDSVKNNYLTSFLLNAHNIEFLLGIVVAIFVSKYSKYHKESFLFGIGLILLFILCSYFTNRDNVTINDNVDIIFLGISFSLIIYGIVGFDRRLTIKYPMVLVFIGSASYSIYLIHYPLVSVLNRIASIVYPQFIPQHHLLFFLVIIICLVAGSIYHLLYERKMLTFLKNKFITQKNIGAN